MDDRYCQACCCQFLKHCWWVQFMLDFIGNHTEMLQKKSFRGRQLPEQAAKQKHPRELKSSHRDFLRLGHDRPKAHARESARKQTNCVTPQGVRCTAVTINPYSTNHVTQRKHKQIIKQSAVFPKGNNFLFLCCLTPLVCNMLTRGVARKCMSNDSNHNSCTTNQGVADSTPLGVPKRQRPTDKPVILRVSSLVWKVYSPAGPGAHISPLSDF